MQWLVYTSTCTPRIKYAWELIFRYVLGIDFGLTDDLEQYRYSDAFKINYSTKRLFPEEVFIPVGNLLYESDIHSQDITIFEWEGLPAFYQSKIPMADLPFDLPAMVFYLVSRYEEYLPFEPDAHGRFSAQQSLAYRAGFLERPLVNEWALRFRALLQQKFPASQFPNHVFQFQPTYDIDMAWSYQHKGWVRTSGAVLRSLLKGDFLSLQQRWRVQTRQETDPFFTFQYLDALHEQLEVRPIYFFLLGDYNRFDTNIPPSSPALRALIKNVYSKYSLGIHPSYGSNGNFVQLQKEIQRLKKLTGEPVLRSRQHFLKLYFPNTYRQLLAAGITHDYTLGYSDAIGFRASIATAYPWYDLEKEDITPLLLHPFQVMDVTLKFYLQLHPAQAIEKVNFIIKNIRSVNGVFCTLWHNSSFSNVDNWAGWAEVYEQIIRSMR